MREADRHECLAAAGMPGELALLLSVEISEETYTMVNPSGTPVGICGIAEGHTPYDKQVWMLATDELLRYRRLFLKESLKWIDGLTDRYTLWNYVDERNTLHIEWLEWIGCEFHGSRTSPYTGTQQRFFTKVKPCVLPYRSSLS